MIFNLRVWPGLLRCLSASCRALFGTGVSVRLAGSITDPSGAAIPSVVVTITETATSQARTGQVRARDGYYAGFPWLYRRLVPWWIKPALRDSRSQEWFSWPTRV